MARRRLTGRRIFISGASGGIGCALAREFAGRGCRLVLNARREMLLQKVTDELTAGGADVTCVAGDITSQQVQQTIQRSIEERWGALDLLVNNAGVGAIGPFADATNERLTRILDVNFVAPATLIRNLLPLLQRGTDPAIVNIGSVLGHVAAPYKSEYCASKFALLGFSNALRIELQPLGIGVLVVSPSTTASDFSGHLLEDASAAEKPPVSQRWAMTPDYVAKRIANALESRKRELFLPSVSGWLMPLLHACPELADWLAKRWKANVSERSH